MGKSAVIIGGGGQTERAITDELLANGWNVVVIARHIRDCSLEVAKKGVSRSEPKRLQLDRRNTTELLDATNGADLVVDLIAFDEQDAVQLQHLAGRVGSLVVLSTGSVVVDNAGRHFDLPSQGRPSFPGLIFESQPTLRVDLSVASNRTYSALKADLERRLLAVDGLPVTVLRPAAIHGVGSNALREWFFIKRALDGRKAAIIAFSGRNRFSTTSTRNLARLVLLAADSPAQRILNAVDEDNLSVADIGRTIWQLMGHDAEIVELVGPPLGDLGRSPWSLSTDLAFSMDAARDQLSYDQPFSYGDAIAESIAWMSESVMNAKAAGEEWNDRFPILADEYGARRWFDYAGEDDYLKSLVPINSPG